MQAYSEFAYIYDDLMNNDINYKKWAEYINNIFEKYGLKPNLIADLACGTGNMTIPLSKCGYEMIGVDISFDMLNVARNKAVKSDCDILFIEQDIKNLDLYGSVDAVLCMIDGVNYITNKNDLLYMFKRIKSCFLNDNGVFIFDISTLYKFSKILNNNTFVYEDDKIYYVWQNDYLNKKRLCKMNLNFFIKSDMGTYRRFDEYHLQKAYSVRTITKMLKEAGFSTVDVYDELSFNNYKPDSQRAVFVAR